MIGGGAVGAEAEITASVPAGVHWRAAPELKVCPCGDLTGTGLGPGFTIVALARSWVRSLLIVL